MRRYDGDDFKSFAKSVGSSVKTGLKSVGSSVKTGLKSVGSSVASSTQKLSLKGQIELKERELNDIDTKIKERDNYINTKQLDIDIEKAKSEEQEAHTKAHTKAEKAKEKAIEKVNSEENTEKKIATTKKDTKIIEAQTKLKNYMNDRDNKISDKNYIKVKAEKTKLEDELKKIENPTQVDGRRRRRSRSKRRRSKRRSDGKKRRHSKRKW
jgi:hypothetical protein